MSRSTKRPRIAAGDASGEDGAEMCDSSSSFIEAVAETSCTTANDFSSDVVANILSYLKLKEIMCKRRVCKKWTEAVRKTVVSPEEEFDVNNVKTFNTMRVLSTVLPNLLSVRLNGFSGRINDLSNRVHVDTMFQMNDAYSTMLANDLEIITGFTKLRSLTVTDAPLNGRYPFLFNFAFLQKLSINGCSYLRWDLEMLSGLPSLKELDCSSNPRLTGNISSLRVLKDTLEKVALKGCSNVEGNFMDLADFSQLRVLHLEGTVVTADFQDISNGDFSTMEELVLRSMSVSGNIRSLRVLKDTLQKLTLDHCRNVEGTFMALADFPHLKTLELRETAVTVDIGDLVNGDFARLEELVCTGFNMSLVSGNIRILRVLKNSLEKLIFEYCHNVEGSFMDLADFPHLRTLNLVGTVVTGDVRDIGKDDFAKLEQLALPHTIYGGHGYELPRISDAPELMRALYLLKKQHPSLKFGNWSTEHCHEDWYAHLSEDSPDWYERMDSEISEIPPFYISLVKAGTRNGYRWENDGDNFPQYCEVNWFDPEPDKDSSDYAKYVEELQEIKEEYAADVYEGYYQPPTQDEYIRLCQDQAYLYD